LLYRLVSSASAGIQFNKFGQEGIDMRINRGISVVAALFSAIGLTACGGGPKVMTEKMPESGFLPNYKVMQVVDNTPKDIHAWRYLKPGIQSSSYTAVMFDPIYLNQAEYTKEITPEVIAQTRKILEEAMRQAIQRRSDIKVVDKPGPGVARVAIGITGAELSADGLKPWNFTPIGLATNAAAFAAGANSKTPALVIENRVTDSQTKEFIAGGMVAIQGEPFRLGSSSVGAFQDMTRRVVVFAMESPLKPLPGSAIK
jgi:Protein of unknown function (DUF3313)